jgi:hypothetical protein
MSLQSITVSPSSGGIQGTGSVLPSGPATANFYKAYGNFIHPKEMIDITSEVDWSSDVPAVATVSSTSNPIPGEVPGEVTATGVDCGTTVITATAGKGVIGPGTANAIVIGTSTYTVTDVIACTGGEPVLAVSFAGAGSGTVMGGGINCIDGAGAASGICQAGFTSGSQVSLTATATGTSTFASWSGCTTIVGANCLVTVSGTGITSVTATFN